MARRKPMKGRGEIFLTCRLLKHAWEDSPTDPYRAPEFGERLVYVCLRCGTLRGDTVSRIDGRLLQRRYTHPDGYKLAKDETPKADDLRRWALDRREKAS